MLVSAKFQIDAEDKAYEGVYDPLVQWNGFACPLFTREVVAEILADWMQSEIIEGYTIASSMVFVHNNDTVADDADEYDFRDVAGLKDVCMLGGYGYTWQVVDEE